MYIQVIESEGKIEEILEPVWERRSSHGTLFGSTARTSTTPHNPATYAPPGNGDVCVADLFPAQDTIRSVDEPFLGAFLANFGYRS